MKTALQEYLDSAEKLFPDLAVDSCAECFFYKHFGKKHFICTHDAFTPAEKAGMVRSGYDSDAFVLVGGSYYFLHDEPAENEGCSNARSPEYMTSHQQLDLFGGTT